MGVEMLMLSLPSLTSAQAPIVTARDNLHKRCGVTIQESIMGPLDISWKFSSDSKEAIYICLCLFSGR